MNLEHWELSSKMEKAFEWRKWTGEIPYIHFPTEWQIKVIPPFGGAVVRFMVLLPGKKEDDRVSVYLDCYDHLGYFGSPYWEVYPHQGDVGRCAMKDVDRLLEMIADRSESREETGL